MATPTIQEILNYSPLNKGEKEILPEFKRNPYNEIEKTINKKFIIAISGLRRVGKTVLVKQLLNKHHGFYFSFDEQRHRNVESLNTVIDTFLDHGAKIIALDEIGYVDGWAGTIKKFYDKSGIKFILSGSSSLKIKKGKESLAGRMFEYSMPTLQFDEYLEMNNSENPNKIWDKKLHSSLFGSFIKSGSFPELKDEKEDGIIQKYLIGLIEKILFEDIPSIYDIKHRSKLYDLLRYVATFAGSQFSESSVANTLGINKNTVFEYALYLSQTFLLTVLHEHGSYARALQKSKKAFVNCAPIYRAITDSYSDGAVAEIAVLDRLLSWGTANLKFYRDYQKREIDFVADNLPIEVKYRTYIDQKDFNNLIYFMDARKLEQGVMVTKDQFDIRKFGEKKILLMPISAFLSVKNIAQLQTAFL